jgi:hypothetical protein
MKDLVDGYFYYSASCEDYPTEQNPVQMYWAACGLFAKPFLSKLNGVSRYLNQHWVCIGETLEMLNQIDMEVSAPMQDDLLPNPKQLARHPLWMQSMDFLSQDERVVLSYKRARLVLNAYGESPNSGLDISHRVPDISVRDVQNCTPKFWALNAEPLFARDFAAFTIVAAHLNLAVGTLVRYLPERPDLKPIIQAMLKLDIIGVYLLTERAHGLDAFNIETTAVRTKDGFILNTPRHEAMKYVLLINALEITP